MSEYCKVVIVDDEFIMRQGMKHMLDWEKEGYQIVGEATNGKEGLELIEAVRPDIVLADIVMPVLDGIEFSKILKASFPQVQLIILSSYDKFEYVKETLLNGAADYILKPALNPDILLKTLNKVAERIPGMQIRKTQHTSSSAQIEKFLLGFVPRLDEALFAEIFPHTLYRVTGMDLGAMCGGDKAQMAQAARLQTEFFEKQGDFVAVPVLMEEEYLCFVLNYRIKDEQTVAEALRSCLEQAAGFREKAFCVVSGSFTSMQKIQKCYKEEILPGIARQFYYPGQHLLFLQQEETAGEEEKRFPFEEYSSALLRRQFGAAIDMLEQYVSHMCSVRMEEDRLKNLTKNLLYNYLMEIEQYDVPVEDKKKIYFKEIEGASYEPQYRAVMEKIIRELRRMQEDKLDSEDLRMMEIKSYINAHYDEELDLKDIADTFGFNYHYLSAWFGRQSKEGFSEYLNKIRIERACAMLREDTASSIAQIGMKVGYTDQSYFSRVFKKLTGDTPSAYRRKHLAR